MTRSLELALVFAALAAGGCHHSRAKAKPLEPMPMKVAMDSAEIDRLCVSPDSVRTGRLACVLKDQSAPRPSPLKAPATPPR